MISSKKFPVIITAYEKGGNNYDGLNYPDNQATVILEANRCIQRMMFNRIYQVMGQQTNAKATYVLYLEINDPDIPQNADVSWVMHGKSYSGKVKFTQPMNNIILNRNRECFIQSDNE
jgi:hypothetical protein